MRTNVYQLTDGLTLSAYKDEISFGQSSANMLSACRIPQQLLAL